MAFMDRDFLSCNHVLTDITERFYETVKSQYDKTKSARIYEAFDFACSIHAMQFRSGDIPFILHPMRVALMLVHFDRNVTSKVFIAALLHDVLETTDLTELEIKEKFGQYVAELVQAVTISHQETASGGKMREDKRQMWTKIIGDDHEVRAIKTFENLDNMLYWRTMPVDDPGRKKIPHWLTETREMSLPLARATNLQAYEIMQQEYRYYVTHPLTF